MLTDAFYGCRKDEKTFLIYDLVIFNRHYVSAVKRDAQFKTRCVKGVPFVNRRNAKGNLF